MGGNDQSGGAEERGGYNHGFRLKSTAAIKISLKKKFCNFHFPVVAALPD